ncbi:MAG: cobalamin biosynthesis protein CobW, partial [Aquificaceae bacterium]
MNLTKTPATVVTGFLGSGKTTLLSNIVKQAGNKRIAIIVNEFGETDI